MHAAAGQSIYSPYLGMPCRSCGNPMNPWELKCGVYINPKCRASHHPDHHRIVLNQMIYVPPFPIVMPRTPCNAVKICIWCAIQFFNTEYEPVPPVVRKSE